MEIDFTETSVDFQDFLVSSTRNVKIKARRVVKPIKPRFWMQNVILDRF